MPQSGLGLIDSHAHIQGKEYTGETAAVIQRAGEAGVEQIIVVGGAGDMSSNTAAVALAESCANLYATVGMHPHDAKDVGEEELQKLKELAAYPKVIAVGETGLDYYYNHSPREVQRRVFAQFIRMAGETGLPLVVHERDAASEAVELLRSEGAGKIRGVIHCFTGDYDAARELSRFGLLSLFYWHYHFQERAAVKGRGPESAVGANVRGNRFALPHACSSSRKAQRAGLRKVSR